MVSKLCCRSHGHPVPWVRSAAMISISRAMSREGVIARSRGKRTRRCGPYNARRRLRHPLRTRPETSPAAAGIRPARPFGQNVDAVFQLAGLLVEQKVVVAEMRAAHVPMEVLGLEIEREGIGQERVERRRYLANGLGRKVGWSIEPCRGGARFKVSDFAAHGLPHGWKGTDTKAAAGTDVHSTADTKGRYSCPVRLATGRPGIRIRDIMEHLRSSKTAPQVFDGNRKSKLGAPAGSRHTIEPAGLMFRRTRHPAA